MLRELTSDSIMSTRRQFLAASLAGMLAKNPTGAVGASVSSAYARAVLSKKPCGYWRFQEAAGPKVLDESGNNHHGMARGFIRYQNFNSAMHEATEVGYVFDGSSAHVEIPHHAVFSQPNSGAGMSVEVWLCSLRNDFSGEGPHDCLHWLGKGDPGQQEWTFRHYSPRSRHPGRISACVFDAKTGKYAEAFIDEPFQAKSSWMHVVATFDAGDATSPHAGVSIYADGRLVSSPASLPEAGYMAQAVMPVVGNAPVRIGTHTKKRFFTGYLDEVAIYPRVLSAEEIANNFRAA